MTHNAFSLLMKHRRLDDTIREEAARRWPDVARIQQLKRLKLAIKDRLHLMASARGRVRTV
jgi:uncharacterized protein